MTARILIASDAPAAAARLAGRLRAEYLGVAVAAGEAATLMQVAEWRPDLIVWHMAAATHDLEFCRLLKFEPRSRDLPLLLIAGRHDPALRLRALELGADDVAEDPPDIDLLLARLQALVRVKQVHDEWRTRSETAQALGVAADARVPGSVAGARALVIEDDDVAARAVQDWLARDGIVPGRAATPDQVATLSATITFDLIVLSLSLLTSDPLRIIADLRAAATTRHVPLLLLCGPGLRGVGLRGFALGADDCLMLPAASEELRARARTQLRRKFHQDRLRADLGQAFEMALTDPLTGCYNRRYLGRHLRGLLASGPPQGVAVLLLDIDRFREVNDRLGHEAGDAALVDVAHSLRDQIRAQDSLARSGGEEFVVVMPGCGVDEAVAAAERLRRTIQELVIPGECDSPCAMTVSVGVSASGGGAMTAEWLLHLAQTALETARARGRNQVASTVTVMADAGLAQAAAE